MNVICLLCDSLNRHFLNAYDYGIAETPNIDRLAQKSFVFDKHFSGSLPTMPTRRELWTGNYEFLWRPWGALEPWDSELPEMLNRAGVLTMLITDSYHLFERGSGNYHCKFEGWELFRGFENDPWVTDPVDTPEHAGRLVDRYARNMSRMNDEEELPPSKTLRCVERWLQKNYTHDQFFLMIDEFAPHEPFNAPEYLVRKYDSEWSGPLLFWPAYGKDLHTEPELRKLRAQYAAHIELIDKYLGRVFETMDDLGLWENTAFILMTDHGHFLGEHGFTGKPKCPQYDTIAHIPCMICHPHLEPNTGSVPERIGALSANIDINPTILDLFGLKPEAPIHGRSLLPLISGEARSVRDWTLYGYYGRSIDITDGKYTYFRAPVTGDHELYMYSLGWEFGKNFMIDITEAMKSGAMSVDRYMKNVEMPVARVPVSHEKFNDGVFENYNHLYDIDADPEQNHNLSGDDSEKTMSAMLSDALESVDCPEEHYKRLGF